MIESTKAYELICNDLISRGFHLNQSDLSWHPPGANQEGMLVSDFDLRGIARSHPDWAMRVTKILSYGHELELRTSVSRFKVTVTLDARAKEIDGRRYRPLRWAPNEPLYPRLHPLQQLACQAEEETI